MHEPLPDTAEPEIRRPVVLIVDDDISNIEMMNAALGDEYEICFATSGEDALELVRSTLPDLILLDVVMPGIQGFEVCAIIKQDPLLSDTPIIFTTGLGDTEDEVRGLMLGAIDYVTKPFHPVILRNRVKNHVEMKRLRDQLARIAVTDALTGLHNRRELERLFRESAVRLGRAGDWLSLVMVDIDFFKQFNDTYGHLSGDRCLFMVASALSRAAVSVEGFPARYGGEEFSCLLPGCDADAARAVAVEIQRQIRQLGIPHAGSAISPWLTVSVGIASARVRDGLVPEEWMRRADEQLYRAKSEGRDRICTATF